MTKSASQLKKLIRERIARTGESTSEARAHVLRNHAVKIDGSEPVAKVAELGGYKGYDHVPHSYALLPVEAWCYMSPDVRKNGRRVDSGLLGEGLLYYDRIGVAISGADHVVPLVSWFTKYGAFKELIELLESGVIHFYYYNFFSAPLREKSGDFSFWNFEDNEASKADVFVPRVLEHESLRKRLTTFQLKDFAKYAAKSVVEVRAADFGAAVDEAKADFENSRRMSLVLQGLVDDVYRDLGLAEPPRVVAQVESTGSGKRATWNLDFDAMTAKLGKALDFHLGTPLSAMLYCNRLLLSASRLGSDLYLGSPLSSVAGDKLFEAGRCAGRLKNVIDSLTVNVDFPNVRALINNGHLEPKRLLSVRKEARRFRQWLQAEGDRDRDAIVAYHNEVGRASRLSSVQTKVLRLFGMLAAGATGVIVGTKVSAVATPVIGTLAGAGAAASVNFAVAELTTHLNKEWRPLVFGKWLKERIEKHLEDEEA